MQNTEKVFPIVSALVPRLISWENRHMTIVELRYHMSWEQDHLSVIWFTLFSFTSFLRNMIVSSWKLLKLKGRLTVVYKLNKRRRHTFRREKHGLIWIVRCCGSGGASNSCLLQSDWHVVPPEFLFLNIVSWQIKSITI